MFCNNCGKELRPGTRVCPYCRHPVGTGAAPDGDRSRETGDRIARHRFRPSKKVAIVAGAVVVAVAIAASAALLATRGHPTQAVQMETASTMITSTSLPGPTATVVSVASTTTSAPASSTTTTTAGPNYRALSGALATTLQQIDGKMADVATRINSTLPQVPQTTHDELQSMLSDMSSALAALGAATIPADQSAADGYLRQAAAAMTRRIQATVKGIEGMWTSGTKSGAGDYFNQGRTERDSYRDLFTRYQEALRQVAATAPIVDLAQLAWPAEGMQPREVVDAIHRVLPAGTVPIYLPRTLPDGYIVPRTVEHEVNPQAYGEVLDGTGYSLVISAGWERVLLTINPGYMTPSDLVKTDVSIGDTHFQQWEGRSYVVAWVENEECTIEVDGTLASSPVPLTVVLDIATNLVRVE